MASKSQSPKLSLLTDGKPISKASEIDGEQLQKKITNDYSANIHLSESPQLLHQEILRWRQKAQEKEQKEKDRLKQTYKWSRS